MDDLGPSGPRRITTKNQLSVPDEYLRAIGLVEGDEVFFVVNPDKPGTLVVIPRALMTEIFRKGWTSVS